MNQVMPTKRPPTASATRATRSDRRGCPPAARLAAVLLCVLGPAVGGEARPRAQAGADAEPAPAVQPGPRARDDADRVGGNRPGPREPGAALRVWLVTAGPGDAVWERYGHNALRVLDTRTGRDVSYNWGFFDFRQADFVARFLRGRMLYTMAPLPTGSMLDQYREADREIVLQELDLAPAEKAALRAAARENALPGNRDYAYRYFLDNCSTRVRDLLDLALGGALREAFAGRAADLGYRGHTRRLAQVDPLVYTGADLLLGTPADRPISAWDELYLPLALRDHVRSVRIVRDGRTRPLVLAEEVVAASARPPEPAEPPAWLGRYLALGLLVGALLAAGGSRRVRASTALRRGVLALAAGWSLLAGGAGTVLAFLLATDHTFAWWNENLFLFHPLLLGLGALLPLSTRSDAWRRRAFALAAAAAALALAGLLWQTAPASTQPNAAFFTLALPPHLGLAWSLRRPFHPGGGGHAPAAMAAGAADGPPAARGRRISGSVLVCEAAGADGPPDAQGRPRRR